jgi:hypothetical protein
MFSNLLAVALLKYDPQLIGAFTDKSEEVYVYPVPVDTLNKDET